MAGPENPPIQIAHPNETADLQAIRAYRTFLGEAEHRIVRGDFHRHTELSWDGGGRTDGSLFDFYRYMLDAAAMDFGAVTDHNAGGDNEYWWWLTEKSCDLYHLPGVFTTFYGYERSARFPHGHRNVFHTTRGIPMVSFFTEPSFGGARPGVGSGDLIANDTKLLYESLRRSGGIAISHTSTSDTMGTDWRDNDPEIEPVVEIFKARASRTSTWAAPARRVVRRTSRPAAFRRRALSGTLTPKVTGWARSPAPTTTPPTFPTRWCTQRSRRVKRSLTLSGSVTPTAHGQYYSGLPDGGALHGR